MWLDNYQWHYDYARLAWDTGFAFEKFKSHNLDKNKICVVDIDRIIRERDVSSVDNNISIVIQYILDEEQTKILDANFVKLFKLSQLAVEYLLFCKKYLDNTVVLLKKECKRNSEENKNLKLLIHELQDQINTIDQQQQNILATFKCSSCNKIFYSEDYLNAHVKRRHFNAENAEGGETNKLNTEIKELKERLNVTEKLLKEKEESSNHHIINNNDKTVLEAFDKFKLQVEGEIKELKLQKNFYEENYDRLFQLFKSQDKIKDNVEPIKIETTTQTDKLLQMETAVNLKNVVELQESIENKNIEDFKANNTVVVSQIKNKDDLEMRITSMMSGVETQMETFWNKLMQLEENSHNKKNINIDCGDAKPKARPRSKFTLPNENSNNPYENPDENLINRIEIIEKPSHQKDPEIPLSPIKKSVIPIEPDAVDREKKLKRFSRSYSVVKEKSPSSSEISKSESVSSKSESSSLHLPKSKENYAINEKLDKKKIKANIEEILSDRLQELGISNRWIHLPEKSYEKSLQTIMHQTNLIKKVHPHFESIKRKINEEVKRRSLLNNNSNAKFSPKIKTIQNIVKISHRFKNLASNNLIKRSPPTTTVNPQNLKINRTLYDSDTDISGGDNKEIKINGIPALEETQKGVLKNYPSIGSLNNKKKVIFNVEKSDSNKIENAPIIQKIEMGSTTSIASSILSDKIIIDDLKGKTLQAQEENELDVLDFELSE